MGKYPAIAIALAVLFVIIVIIAYNETIKETVIQLLAASAGN